MGRKKLTHTRDAVEATRPGPLDADGKAILRAWFAWHFGDPTWATHVITILHEPNVAWGDLCEESGMTQDELIENADKR